MNNPKSKVQSPKWVQAFELILAVFFLTLGAGAQPSGTRQATDAEVAGGANVRAFVNPRQAQGVGIATNGQTALQVAGAVNASSNSLFGIEQTAINTSSNAVLGNAQTAINTGSNSIVGIEQTAINTSSNAVLGNAQTAINTSSNALQAQIGAGGGSGIPTVNGTGTGTILVNPKFPAVTNDFWVSTSGSDANAGNFGAPFATATNAIAAVPAGNASVIHFGPGTFNCGTNQLTLASNMKLMGAGKFATTLLSTCLGAGNPHQFILFPPMNGEIADMTLTNNAGGYCIMGGGDDGHVNSFTNMVIRNTAWFGYSDIFALEGNNGPSSGDVYDSYLYTWEDVTISGGTSGAGGDPGGSTNNVLRFHNCDITSNPSSATSSPNGLSSAVGLIWAEGCNIHPVKTNGTVYAVGIVSTGLGYIRLDNCILGESGTNVDSDFHCVKTPQSPYLIINNCRRPDGGPLNGNGYFFDGNGVKVTGSNSVNYGYGYTNAAPNSVAIGNSTATLTMSNGVIAAAGVLTGDGGGLTNINAARLNLPPTTNYPAITNIAWVPGQVPRYAGYTNSDGSRVFTNANVVVVLTNGVQMASNIDVIDITNATVAPKIVGGVLRLDLTGSGGAGGSASNAIANVYTNGVFMAGGVTNINFTNFTVAPTVASGMVTVDGTASGGGGSGVLWAPFWTRNTCGSIAAGGNIAFTPGGNEGSSVSGVGNLVPYYIGARSLIWTNISIGFGLTGGAKISIATNLTFRVYTNSVVGYAVTFQGGQAGNAGWYTNDSTTAFKVPANCDVRFSVSNNNATASSGNSTLCTIYAEQMPQP